MQCEKCGEEIEDYKGIALRICDKCLKEQVEKLRYIAENPKEMQRGYEEG